MTTNRHAPSPPVHRAGRYPLRTAIRFRLHGQSEWRHGVTEDISRTGVFFRSSFVLPNGSEIEMVLSLPGNVWGKSSGTVLGQGRVVRHVPPSRLDPDPGLAATIQRYRLERKDATLPGTIPHSSL